MNFRLGAWLQQLVPLAVGTPVWGTTVLHQHKLGAGDVLHHQAGLAVVDLEEHVSA